MKWLNRVAEIMKEVEDGNNDNGQQDFRDRLIGIGEAHHQLLDTTAEIAGEQSQRRAERERHGHRQHTDCNRQPRAMNQPREQIAAEIVGAQHMDPVAAVGIDSSAQRA